MGGAGVDLLAVGKVGRESVMADMLDCLMEDLVRDSGYFRGVRFKDADTATFRVGSHERVHTLRRHVAARGGDGAVKWYEFSLNRVPLTSYGDALWHAVERAARQDMASDIYDGMHVALAVTPEQKEALDEAGKNGFSND